MLTANDNYDLIPYYKLNVSKNNYVQYVNLHKRFKTK